MRGIQGLSALDAAEPYDVCIIGSGFAGTIVGIELARAGARTLLLESGGGLMRWFVDRRVRDLAAYEVSGDTRYPTTRTKARALGGNSNFWTGRCNRFHPSDFQDHSFTPRDNPWPLTYSELEPWYERAERTLQVRGGALSAYMPPRRNPLPVPPRSDISDLKELCGRAGVVVDDSLTATPQKALRFFRVEHELLPDFLAAPNAVAVAGATVTRLLVDRDRRVVGAEARTLDGGAKVARAKLYLVACGGIETPRLLLLSRSEDFPNGIGNDHDRVGRGFNEHPGVNLYGKFRHNRGTLYHGTRSAEVISSTSSSEKKVWAQSIFR
jgi:glucose dehydrogenase